MEEGIVTAKGFANMAGLGFPLGDFEGNAVPVDERLLDQLSAIFSIGPIATVATCSGTDAAAAEVVRRTGALAEAMEGAAVVHAARRLKVPAIELRAISNTTGDRANQQWDLQAGLAALGQAVRNAVSALRKAN
jgi:futalosine hydrolase